jgi:hypothetical protein
MVRQVRKPYTNNMHATETLCMSWPPLDQQQQTNMQHLHSYATMILRKLSREHMSLCKYQNVRLQAVKLRHDIPMIPILADLDKRHSVGNRERDHLERLAFLLPLIIPIFYTNPNHYALLIHPHPLRSQHLQRFVEVSIYYP